MHVQIKRMNSGCRRSINKKHYQKNIINRMGKERKEARQKIKIKRLYRVRKQAGRNKLTCQLELFML